MYTGHPLLATSGMCFALPAMYLLCVTTPTFIVVFVCTSLVSLACSSYLYHSTGQGKDVDVIVSHFVGLSFSGLSIVQFSNYTPLLCASMSGVCYWVKRKLTGTGLSSVGHFWATHVPAHIGLWIVVFLMAECMNHRLLQVL